ncbi:MAG: polyphosphate polymerase domain-containing protein [Propionibacteriaceae bacterium]
MAIMSLEAAPVASFAPISLAELNQEHSLMSRVDRKYALTQMQTSALLAALPSDTQILDIAGDRAFDYRSVYFDTDDMESFLLSARGRRRRWKVRTRHYVDSGDSFLEVKTAERFLTTKDRRLHADTDQLHNLDLVWVRATLKARGIVDLPRYLNPVLETRYRRTTLALKDSRITIDMGLTWSQPHEEGIAPSDLVVVETKSPGGAGDVDRLLWRAGIRPTKLSKYGTGAAVIFPELPRNKWNRVLKKHCGTH